MKNIQRSPDILNHAWFFATIAHSGQTYGGPEPGMRIDYLNHIGSVIMEILWAIPNTTDCNADLAIQCAALHDTIEDTTVTFEHISEKFSIEVAKGVQALTKNTALKDKNEQMSDSLERIKQSPKEIGMVKMADRISNLYHPPFYWNNQKKTTYLEEAQLIYNELKDCNEMLANRLAEKIETYKKFIK